MSPIDALAAMAFFTGAALLLERVRPLRRAGLTERVRPYVAPTTSHQEAVRSGVAVGAVMAPLADSFGNAIARLMGVRTSLDLRLSRAGRRQAPAQFRLAQLTRALISLGVAALALLAVRPGVAISAAVLLGVPALTALLEESRLDSEAAARRANISLELPVVAEQLGILLGAGLSLGACLDRLARRGNGIVATDMSNVVREVRRGRSEVEALRDWAEMADSPAVERLVSVLSLHRDARDLGTLISNEARAIRDETHRQMIETIERRAQLVWVPVTVATLVPGLILIGVPFVQAMSAVAG